MLDLRSAAATALLVIVLASCGKEAAKVDPDYVGYWKSWEAGCEPHMRIPADGEGDYTWGRLEKECQNMHHHGVPRISGGYLRIGSKRLKITAEPYATDPVEVSVWHLNNVPYVSTMRLELEGKKYYRFDGY